MALILYPNGLNALTPYLGPEDRGPSHPFTDNPEYDLSPSRIVGTPQDDLITFFVPRFLYFNVHGFWAGYFAQSVKQRRLATGEIVLESNGGTMLRACWDIADNRTGGCFTETATGVMQAVATVGSLEESWQLILYRGDYKLTNGVLEIAERACGGGAATPSPPPSGGGEPVAT